MNSFAAFAEEDSKPMHWSGDKTLWDRKNNKVELFGNATVTQPGESLIADYIHLDLNQNTLYAKGHCYYVASDAIIYGDELFYNLETHVGTVVRGRVASESFMLMGERINKLGPGRFQTYHGEYSTCHDCPNSWSLVGDDVDIQFEGYAYMRNVSMKVKDTPVFWIPYLILPLKTKRQTGFLFPKMGRSTISGFKFVQPFFWATGRSTDMTIALGTYSAKGLRGEWEGRYATYGGSATGNVYYQKDRTEGTPKQSRWALGLLQSQELPFEINEKIKFYEISDNQYPIDFEEDVPGIGQSVLSSDFILSHSSKNVSSFIAARRHRNLLNPNSRIEFDRSTVQQLPYGLITSNDRKLFKTPVTAGLTFGASRFSRTAGIFDYDQNSTQGDPYNPGVDPLRKATRATLVPSLYTTLRPFDVLSVVPSVQYRSYFYNFDNQTSNLQRGYLIFQTQMSAQFEKIYETDNPEIPRIKHLIRPELTYSRIPYIREPDHPFVRQVKFRSGYQFDNYDVVPMNNSTSTINYFTPLGHSISYGATTQVISRMGRIEDEFSTYKRNAELQVGQTFNLLELKEEKDNQVPFSRFYSLMNLSFNNFDSSIQYYYYPYLGRILRQREVGSQPSGSVSPHELSSSFSYTFEKSVHQKVLSFERRVGLSYAWSRIDSSTSNLGSNLVYSLNDYVMPKAGISYDFFSHRLFKIDSSLTFQSPSRCWKFTTSFNRYISRPGWDISFDLSLNLTGQDFSSVSDLGSGKAPGA